MLTPTAPSPDAAPCGAALDPLGLVPAGCWSALLEAERRGYVRGYATAHRERDAQEADADAALWSEIQTVARNVATDPARTWAPPGQPQRRGMALRGGGR